MKEALRSSETLVLTGAIRRNIPKHAILHVDLCSGKQDFMSLKEQVEKATAEIGFGIYRNFMIFRNVLAFREKHICVSSIFRIFGIAFDTLYPSLFKRGSCSIYEIHQNIILAV
jgi:hypothetical protein